MTSDMMLLNRSERSSDLTAPFSDCGSSVAARWQQQHKQQQQQQQQQQHAKKAPPAPAAVPPSVITPRIPLALQQIFINAQLGEEVQAPSKNMGSRIFIRSPVAAGTAAATATVAKQTSPPTPTTATATLRNGLRRSNNFRNLLPKRIQSRSILKRKSGSNSNSISHHSSISNISNSNHSATAKSFVQRVRRMASAPAAPPLNVTTGSTDSCSSSSGEASASLTSVPGEVLSERRSSLDTNDAIHQESPIAIITAAPSISPRMFLEQAWKERGYTLTPKFCTVETGYYNQPTPYQQASYGPRVLDAIRTNDIMLMKRLLQAGLSPNPCNRFGDSVVHMVCRRSNSAALLQLLQEYGCNLQFTDDYGRTPLHDACYRSHANQPDWQVITMLLKSDYHLLQAMDCYGKSPLSYVPASMYQAWIDYFQDHFDVFWPTTTTHDKQQRSLLARQRPHSSPVKDPPTAIPLDLAGLIANGNVEPEEAYYYNNAAGNDVVGNTTAHVVVVSSQHHRRHPIPMMISDDTGSFMSEDDDDDEDSSVDSSSSYSSDETSDYDDDIEDDDDSMSDNMSDTQNSDYDDASAASDSVSSSTEDDMLRNSSSSSNNMGKDDNHTARLLRRLESDDGGVQYKQGSDDDISDEELSHGSFESIVEQIKGIERNFDNFNATNM